MLAAWPRAWTAELREPLKEALDLHEAGKFKEAIAAYDKAIKANPNLAEAYFNRGNAHYDLGQNQQALKDYSEAIRLNPQDSEAYFNRANVYRRLKQDKPALNDYGAAIKLNPNDARSYVNRGSILFDARRYSDAVKDFSEAIRIEPKEAQHYYNRGNSYLALNQKEDAIKDYDAALTRDPKLADAYYNRGIAYADSGKHAHIVATFRAGGRRRSHEIVRFVFERIDHARGMIDGNPNFLGQQRVLHVVVRRGLRIGVFPNRFQIGPHFRRVIAAIGRD